MSEPWETLTDKQKKAITSKAKKLSDDEINERFTNKDGNIVFRIFRKSDKALAGKLDIDKAGQEYEADTSLDCSQPEKEEIEISEVPLIPADEFDYEPEEMEYDKDAAKIVDEKTRDLMPYYEVDEISSDESESENDLSPLPPIVDHRPSQSSVKNQGYRGTCVAHASLGLMESFDHIPDDLSEQCAHYKFNEFMNRPHNYNSGLRTTDAAKLLSRSDGKVCEEKHWPYITSQYTINQMVKNKTYAPPRGYEEKTIYGYMPNAYKIITDRGLEGESIKNTKYLESLLQKGYNIVIGTWVSWDDKDNDGILDPVLASNGKPLGLGGHAMLLVGYNSLEQYFIVKNSWGRGWGHNGYAYLHYNLARSCFKYGFVVDSVLPEKNGNTLSRSLRQAPYETGKISRDKLGAAVLFMRTSHGRYAVCEAYAGENLLLKNIRVYNEDGSVHLERESLIIRKNYLCDLDSGRETSMDADFWWQSSILGNNNLVPRNRAGIYIAFDFADLDLYQIRRITLNTRPVSSKLLNYAVVVGKTTAGRSFKMLVHACDDGCLNVSYLELFKPDGNRYRYTTNVKLSPWHKYNLDTLKVEDGRYADIWWHKCSTGENVLESYSSARIKLLWNI
ncbi:hypothetical protein GF312_03215 [Candidatus Poribacteria bacterium]|nr:hypothetical protein [Candidatus Poribacteria bacterium]